MVTMHRYCNIGRAHLVGDISKSEMLNVQCVTTNDPLSVGEGRGNFVSEIINTS